MSIPRLLQVGGFLAVLSVVPFQHVSAQPPPVGECCDRDPHVYFAGCDPPVYMEACVGALEGWDDCTQWGECGLGGCLLPPWPPDCETEGAPDGTVTAFDLLLVAPEVMGRLPLIAERRDPTLRFTRSCDGAVVRRAYTLREKESIRARGKLIRI